MSLLTSEEEAQLDQDVLDLLVFGRTFPPGQRPRIVCDNPECEARRAGEEGEGEQ